MKKTREQKGITLIALIITIVVLMILAAVAINSITNDGIIGKAESVKNTYTEAQNEEQKMLDYYQLVLEGTAWTQNGTKVTRGNQTLNVGEKVTLKLGTADAVAYSDNIAEGAEGDYAGDWAVLGAEYGKLLLVSASDVKSDVGMRGAYGDTSGEYEAGYYNGVEYLNNLCSKYKNETYADNARSIKIEDLNRIVGYELIRENGAVTYTFTSWFNHIDGRIASDNNPITITGVTYSMETSNDILLGIPSLYGYYWLANRYFEVSDEYTAWYLAGFGAYEEYCWLERDSLWLASEGALQATLGARAVVSIKSDVQVSKAS